MNLESSTATAIISRLLPLAIGINIDFQGLFTALQPDIYFGGDSAMFWKPLAWTIIFGLAFANFLTLVVIPAMYLIVARVKTWITGLRVKNLAPQTF
ncbi:MAG TPA: efflux RND transporter permease subunit [Bacteroidales bacterium]|nr:efflux RND transporter permease subunit [Bacteroidales bacterium]